MMSEAVREFVIHSPEETLALARALGRGLWAGAALAFTGPLGAGKTAFIQGLARGLGVPETVPVTSPTYTFINEYPGRLVLYHADLYRAATVDDLEGIGFFEILDLGGVSAVEWAERAEGCGFNPDFSVELRVAGEASREIRLTAYGQRAVDLINALKI